MSGDWRAWLEESESHLDASTNDVLGLARWAAKYGFVIAQAVRVLAEAVEAADEAFALDEDDSPLAAADVIEDAVLKIQAALEFLRGVGGD